MFLKNSLYTIIILLIFGCSSNENYKIDSVWYVREHTPNVRPFSHCDECDTLSINCCIYKYNKKLYDRGESYVLDQNGKIDSVYSYRVPLGVNIISVEDQISLTTYDSVYRKELRTRKIYWNTKLNSIIDGDTVYNDFITDKNNKYLIIKTEYHIKLYKYR